jgi:hypothetical protein
MGAIAASGSSASLLHVVPLHCALFTLSCPSTRTRLCSHWTMQQSLHSTQCFVQQYYVNSVLVFNSFVLFCRDGQVRAPLHCLNRNTAFFSGMENQRETQDQKICIWVNQNIYGRPVQEKRERRGMLESRLAFSLSLPALLDYTAACLLQR